MSGSSLGTLCVLWIFVTCVRGIYIRAPKGKESFAQYPKWNACINASLSFEFKTKQGTGILMYTDDGGSYDFFELSLEKGVARLRINIVNGHDGSVEFQAGQSLNDSKWHRVTILRNRMETTFSVDQESSKNLSYGSDFYFGNLGNNSDVYFGGLPEAYMKSLEDLALPSVMFSKRLAVEIRNVIYGNCSCEPVRGSLIRGVSLDGRFTEACDQRNPCGDCLCISVDAGPKCQCDETDKCGKDTSSVFYHLPMNTLIGRTSVNPSGLDANIDGSIGLPKSTRGVMGNAIRIRGRREWLQVTGPGHRYECFGDLEKCNKGYTLGLWVKFNDVGDTEGIYLSNGGHSSNSHGIAMTYKLGELEFVFRTKSGLYWNVKYDNVLEDKWYHVLVTWTKANGVKLYINGDLVSKSKTPEQRLAMTRKPRFNEFLIGRSNDRTGLDTLGTITVDELKFWSEYKDEFQVRELGPMYRYYLAMEEITGRELVVENMAIEVLGNVQTMKGKIGNALKFNKDGGNVDMGDFSTSCLGNPDLCLHGFIISFWMKLDELRNHSYYFSSPGIDIYSVGKNLYAVVQAGNRKWEARTYGLEKGIWQYLEVTWSESKGLSIYIDLRLAVKQVGHSIESPRKSTRSTFYIGRANYANLQEYPYVLIDDVEMLYGERETLLFLDLIQRGKPTKNYFSFDRMIGDRLYHPSMVIETYGSPKLVTGKIGQGIKLNGNSQVVDFGEHQANCLGNLDNCHHGVLLAMWFNPTTFRDNMYFASTGNNGITIKNTGSRLEVSATTSTREWNISTEVLSYNNWYFMEISWDPEKGLELYINDNLVSSTNTANKKAVTLATGIYTSSQENKFYLGRGNTRMTSNRFGNAMYDELEYWYGPREYLIAFGYIQRGKPKGYLIDMEARRGNDLVHQDLPLRLHGGPQLVQGVIGYALHLDGNNQYLDVGIHDNECLGNLQKCSNGITVSSWLNFKDYTKNMYILSTGNNGIRMYQKAGETIAVVHQNGKEWEVAIPNLEKQVWHFVELSWHPDFGLNMYVNNTLVSHSSYTNVVPNVRRSGTRVYVGRANNGDTGETTTTAMMTADEMEVWYGRREGLVAFDYILRDNIQHETISLETASGGVVLHPRLTITLANGARLTNGRIGRGVSLEGFGQYLDLGNNGDKCMGNLRKCKNGLTVSLWIKARKLEDGTYFLSSPSNTLSYNDGQLISRFFMNGKMWEVSTPNIKADRWQQVVMSWSPTDGVELYLDGKKQSSTSTWSSFQGDDPNVAKTYVGRSTDNSRKTVNALVDEIQYIYAQRDQAIASGQLQGYVNHQALPLDRVPRIENGKFFIKLPIRTIYLHGNPSQVQGQHGRAIRINGKSQYLDFGDDLICKGNLANCESRGFTVQFTVKPERLIENMYLVDSFPLSVYYRDGKLWATARTPTMSWTTSTPDFIAGEWQLVEITWQPQRGLTLLVDGKEESHQTFGTPQQEIREWDRKTYFGRSLSDMIRERYADATLERLDVWNVQKEYLQVHGLIGSNNTVSGGYTVSGTHNVTTGGSGHSINIHRVNITTSNEEVTIKPGVEVVPDVFTRVINDDRRIKDIPGARTTFIRPEGDTHLIKPPVIDSGVDIIVLNGTILRETKRRTTPAPVVTTQAQSDLYEDVERQVFRHTRRYSTHTIRFLGSAYIHYDFGAFGINAPKMMEVVTNETFHFQFITKKANGLLWLDNRPNQLMYLAMKDGYLTFYLDDGTGQPQQVQLRPEDYRDLNDWRWHKISVERMGRHMRFFIDEKYAGELFTRSAIQMVAPGDVYLGGSPDTIRLTDRHVQEGFDGALTEVIYTKYARNNHVTIISLLAHIETHASTHGRVIIYKPNEFGTRPPQPVTTPTPRPKEIVLFRTISILQFNFHIRATGYIDMRNGGELSFRFRTHQMHGLLFVAGTSGSFFSCEIVDGYLYFVYDFGAGAKRVRISSRSVTDGQPHSVRISFTYGRRVTVYYDNTPTTITLSGSETSLYFRGGIWFGGPREDSELSWYMISRNGFVGCLLDFILRDTTTDFTTMIVQNVPELSQSCVVGADECAVPSICGTGKCSYHNDLSYHCYCAGTGMAGDRCDIWPVTAAFEAREYVLYHYSRYLETHLNDFSLRFRTKQNNALLFQTYSSQGHNDFIRGEIENGRIKITIRINGKDQVFYTGFYLNDDKWHTFNLRRRANDLELWVDNSQQHQTETISGQDFYIHYDKIYFGSVRDVYPRLRIPDFHGYMHNVYVDRVDIFEKLKQHSGGHWPSLIFTRSEWERHVHGHVDMHTARPQTPKPTPKPTTSVPLPTKIKLFSTMSILVHDKHYHIPGYIDLRQGGEINFRFRSLLETGLLLTIPRSTSLSHFMSFEVFEGKLYFVYDFGVLTRRVLVSNDFVSSGQWQNVRLSLTGSYLLVYLNNKPTRIELSSTESNSLYFGGGIWIGAQPKENLSWYSYARHGYVGCIGDLTLHRLNSNMRLESFITGNGISNQCTVVTRHCDTANICGTGTCRYSGNGGYECHCEGTGFGGDRCDRWPITSIFEDGHYILYNYLLQQRTHNNDFSVRFRTSQDNAILFQTHSTRGQDEYIRAVLENGRIKVTVRIDGVDQVYYVGENLNDNHWHTFNLRRYGNLLKMWVDNLAHKEETLKGENFYIHYDDVYYGSLANLYPNLNIPSFSGSMHNVYIDSVDIFDELKQHSGGHWPIFIHTEKEYNNYHFRPVTFVTSDVYADLAPLHASRRMHLTFNFKTGEKDGILLFTRGGGKQFIGVQLIGGQLYVKFHNGIRQSAPHLVPTPMLNNNQWHVFVLRERTRGEQRQFEVSVDNLAPIVINLGTNQLVLTGRLYIGGISANEYLDSFVREVLQSNHGFIGCMSSVELNGHTPELMKYASNINHVITGCEAITPCPLDACLHGGICIPGIVGFTCNCQTTAYWGLDCGDYPNGTIFGSADNKHGGLIMYTFDDLQVSNSDEIVFGFMTFYENGLLYKAESRLGNEYIDIRLENGFIIAEYDTGSGKETLRIDSKTYNDGKYHVVKFKRTGERADLIVDSLSAYNIHQTSHSAFDEMHKVFIGGHTDSAHSTILDGFNGIIGGAYWNKYRFIDLAHHNDARINIVGDYAVLIDKHGYHLHTPVIPTRPPVPPIGPGPHIVPDHIGGSGSLGPGASGIGGGIDVIHYEKIGGISGGFGTNPGLTGNLNPLPQTAGGGPAVVPPPSGGGVRAGAAMGTLLGTMAFLASLMWAFWRLKPGVITCPGGGGGGPPPATISPPTATNLPVVKAMAGTAEGSGAGSGAGGGTKITVVNGSAGAGGGGGGGGGYSSYYTSSTTTATAGGGGGGGGGVVGDVFDSATLRATGTFSNKGTIIGTPKATRAYLGSASSAGSGGGGGVGGGTSSYLYQKESTTYKSGGGGGGGGSGYNMAYGESTTADYDMATPANYTSNTLSSSMGSGLGGATVGGSNTMSKNGYNTMTSSYSYQVQNVRTMMANQAGNQMVQYSGTSSGAVTPGAAGDEVRVDCCLMATDGRSVVTGSSLGPPQVWDMQNGELLRIMKGDTVGSTNLHLACNDRLLVGAVHADIEVNEYSTRKGVANKKLQIWDYTTGKPLEMGTEETCSALCVMSDPDKVVFARSEKFGNATHIIVWDLLGNQALKEVKYDAPVGNNDYVNFLKLSHNDRYCVLGFTNSFDNHAEFVVFDMNQTQHEVTDPCLLRLDANTDCTVILPRDEAVTGLRNGDLVVWSLRTGQPSRQLLSGTGVHAHNKEVKAVVLSDDNRYLVSASADGTLKVWDMQTERQISTLRGHKDEVWCVAISPDNEIVVSGGKDASIRLWRMKNGSEICAFSTAVDVFYVTMSHDKGTIVALGDKFGARKLIMLQVVRTKIRRTVTT
ncbi:uncharacterized protein LOC125678424 isoform X7 [Ostrea edulis]|uniref:uncharacterized protein LOC125678424 isoform X7 n=1 Tax=Ostrea edulis TaxID=37623 RepID=UPI0024AEDBE4|nr:uncharacterized protein LOC125678424 isoform X7 [Ostrea edulis]